MSHNNGYDEFHDEDFNKDIPINGPSESENRGNQNQNKNTNSQFVINGNNLYICSEYTGNGKTSWACKELDRGS